MKRIIIAALAVLVLADGLARAGALAVSMSAPVAVAPPAEFRPQYFAHVAWSPAANFWLVVWQDGDPTEDGTAEGRAQDIFAARVSADGKILDAKPIEVAAVKGAQQRPRVASDGRDFLVVWHDLRGGKDWDVYAARVSADGKVLDEGGCPVADGEHNQCFPDLVFAGGNCYVAWLDMRHWPEYRVYGGRLSPQGQLIDRGGLEIIRVMSDAEMDAWRKAPFAPGKSGTGWHNFGVRGTSGIRQPGPPSLGTDGKLIVVSAGLHAEESDGYAVRAIDSASGKPSGDQHTLRLPSRGGRNRWVRQSHVAVPQQGFISANLFYPAGFGASGEAHWMTSFIGPDGRPAGDKEGRFEMVFQDADARCPSGYRTYGLRTTILDLAWGGRVGLFVAEHHSQEPVRGDIDIKAVLISADSKRLGDGPALDIASGPAVQSAPTVSAGPAGRFLVVWQEETATQDSRITARIVRAE